ncbi:MAG: helix-turn-helix domain-containing protein [Propionibacteriales bacterium]|nr:helix-turn-helix domain-containing protein [Propionibacteriales bacterium]
MPERSFDGVTLAEAEAAMILGCSVTGVRRLIANGALPPTDRYRHRRLARADVEALALRTYRWRRHLDDAEPYWVTGRRAAEVLEVNVTRLNQLAAEVSCRSRRTLTGLGCTGASSWRWWRRRERPGGTSTCPPHTRAWPIDGSRGDTQRGVLSKAGRREHDSPGGL